MSEQSCWNEQIPCRIGIVSWHGAENNHVLCVSSLSLCSHLLKQSAGTPPSAQTSAITAAQEPLYATSQLRSALFSLIIARITQTISFIFTDGGEDRPRITRGRSSRQQLTEDFPKAQTAWRVWRNASDAHVTAGLSRCAPQPRPQTRAEQKTTWNDWPTARKSGRSARAAHTWNTLRH